MQTSPQTRSSEAGPHTQTPSWQISFVRQSRIALHRRGPSAATSAARSDAGTSAAASRVVASIAATSPIASAPESTPESAGTRHIALMQTWPTAQAGSHAEGNVSEGVQAVTVTTRAKVMRDMVRERTVGDRAMSPPFLRFSAAPDSTTGCRAQRFLPERTGRFRPPALWLFGSRTPLAVSPAGSAGPE